MRQQSAAAVPCGGRETVGGGGAGGSRKPAAKPTAAAVRQRGRERPEDWGQLRGGRSHGLRADVRRDKSEEVWALKLGRRSGGRTVTELDAENAGDPPTPVLMR